jgi:hypothetical protein
MYGMATQRASTSMIVKPLKEANLVPRSWPGAENMRQRNNSWYHPVQYSFPLSRIAN